MKKRFRLLASRSISHRILLSMLILVFLPMTLIVFYVYNKVIDITEEEFKAYSTQIVNQIEHNLTTYLRQLETMTYTISSNAIIQDYLKLPESGYELEKMNALLEVSCFEKSVRYDHLENSLLVISGINGELYSSKRYMSNLNYDYDFMDNQYTNELRDTDNHVLFVATHDNQTTKEEKLIISVIRDIYDVESIDSSKKILGYMYLDVDYLVLNKIIKEVIYENKNDILILDDNRIIFSANEDKILQTASGELLEEVAYSRNGGQFITIEGVEYFFTYTTMDKTNWKIVNLHLMEEFNQKARNLVKSIIIMSAVCYVVLFFMAVAISNAITRPIKELAGLMRKVEAQDFGVSFNMDRKLRDELSVLGSVFNSMVLKIRELIESVLKSKIVEKDAMIYALQSQINPHFLYNTFQSISSIAQLEGVDDISEICQCLSSMLRYNLNGSERFVMLYYEVENIRNFFYLQSIQHRDRIEFLIDIPQEFLSCMVPRFILQPLVENSILHGLCSVPSGGKVMVKALKRDNILEIIVEDNGTGIDPEKLAEINGEIEKGAHISEEVPTKHLGIKNVNSRMVLYYGKEYVLKIRNLEGGGVQVIIRIPVEDGGDGKQINGSSHAGTV